MLPPSARDVTYQKWSLYWVSSDGEEDCFVVARNSRSAARHDADYCGFDRADMGVERVKSIPSALIRTWITRRRKTNADFELPWYADDWLLRRLGAQFRPRDSLYETLIDDVVYTQGEAGPFPPRTIGKMHLREFQSVKAFQRHAHEDRYSNSQMILFSLLGICVARCQEIEHLIAHSFILAALSPSERKRNRTIQQTVDAWKRKTLGQMLAAIDEGYEIEPTVHAALRLFLSMRNELVHGVTTSDRYDIHTSWGQDELIGFLSIFELISQPLREAFQASLYASIEIGNETLLADQPARRIALTNRQKKKVSLFAAFFSPRDPGSIKSGGPGNVG